MSLHVFKQPLNCDIPDDEMQFGKTVFHNFVHHQFQEQDLSDDPIIDDESRAIFAEHSRMSAQSYEKPSSVAQKSNIGESPQFRILSARVGARLDELSKEFAKSHQRNQIREHANQVDLSGITFVRFWDLLEGVFRHGIDKYNIIALFCFCADILIRATKSAMTEIGKNLFKWALKYIAEKVCTWIYKQGGWEKAFREFGHFKYIAFATSAVVVTAIAYLLGLYILRK